MKVESSIKESYSTTNVEPVKSTEEIIKAICEWNEISLDDFKHIVWPYSRIWKTDNWVDIYSSVWQIIDPVMKYVRSVYEDRDVVFEKGNDKFFWKIKIEDWTPTKYQLGDKVVDVPFRIRAVNEDTGDWITIFPKKSDILQRRMKNMYVVNTGWAERQRIEKEIMAKFIELAKVKGWNEIISTQDTLEKLKAKLKRSNIDLDLWNPIVLTLPRRTIRDVAGEDDDYIAPPIQVSIDFDRGEVKSKGYSSHWFGTPSSWGNPCWWNFSNDIYHKVNDCDLQELVNLIITWGYWYNSSDTWMSHEDRHPLAKLRSYLWWAMDNSRPDIEDEIKKHIEQIKHDVELDGRLEDNLSIKEYLSRIESRDETSEQW